MKLSRFKIIWILASALAVFGNAVPAYAIQVHPAPEGFYVHQAGHILFLASMFGFSYKIHLSGLTSQKAWRCIIYGVLFLAFWNCWAFSGHLVGLFISQEHFAGPNGPRQSLFLVESTLDFIYYLLKMDHFFCVPALIFLLCGLRKLLQANRQSPLP